MAYWRPPNRGGHAARQENTNLKTHTHAESHHPTAPPPQQQQHCHPHQTYPQRQQPQNLCPTSHQNRTHDAQHQNFAPPQTTATDPTPHREAPHQDYPQPNQPDQDQTTQNRSPTHSAPHSVLGSVPDSVLGSVLGLVLHSVPGLARHSESQSNPGSVTGQPSMQAYPTPQARRQQTQPPNLNEPAPCSTL